MILETNTYDDELLEAELLGEVVEGPKPDIYDGGYEIIPKTYAQTLPTANKLMKEDLMVKKMPFDSDTSDATATASDILDGETAYAHKKKITGSMPNNGAINGKIAGKNESYSIPIGYHNGSGEVEIADAEKAKIIPENIKAGVDILGMIGEYKGETIKAQSKNVTPSKEEQTVLPDSGYDYLSKVNVSAIPEEYIIPSGTLNITKNGTHDVRQYENVSVDVQAEMDTFERDAEWVRKTITYITVPDDVSEIPQYFFYNYKDLADVDLPEGLKSIGQYGFAYCSNLALTSLPENLTSIGDASFAYCSNLALTSLPENLTSINSHSFNSCSNLALTSLPENLTSIGQYSFYNCYNLMLTSLPKRLKSISSYAFENCGKLAIASFPENLTSVTTRSFFGCSNLTFITLPEGLTTMAARAFGSCKKLQSVTFKGKPTSIASDAFYNCTNLKELKVPWSENDVANAPWGATNATIYYNYTGDMQDESN